MACGVMINETIFSVDAQWGKAVKKRAVNENKIN